MAWIYLAGSEDSRLLSASGCDPLHTAKSSDTPPQSYSVEWLMDIYQQLQSSPTLDDSEQKFYQASTSFMVASPVRTLAQRDLEKAWKESEAAYSSKSAGWLAKFDPNSFSWKTSQRSLFGDWSELSLKSLRSGMIVDGQFCQPRQLEPRISGKDGGYLLTPTKIDGGSGTRFNKSASKGASNRPALGAMARFNLWPTPRARDGKGCSGAGWIARGGQKGLCDVVERKNGAPIGGRLNPPWVEWLMGYPCGYTELRPSVIQWFRNARAKRSKSCVGLETNNA